MANTPSRVTDDRVQSRQGHVTPAARGATLVAAKIGGNHTTAQPGAAIVAAPLFIVADDTHAKRLAQAIMERTQELEDISANGTPHNRARWWALIATEETFQQLYGISAYEFLGA
jgi:hypothetical protein